MSRHLLAAAAGRPVELEVSVDETDTPDDSPAEHFWVASELRRLGVRWVSLAPRFVGRFEKGVDYIGDLGELETDVAAHAAIARHFGPYKLSLHSGSDKFSVYPIAARLARGLVHLKTAGTSYLEALRTVAAVDPRSSARSTRSRASATTRTRRATTSRRSFGRAPRGGTCPRADLPGLLDQFDARQILHVTFGSVLKEAGPDGRSLQGHALRPPAREPRGLRPEPRAPLRPPPAAVRELEAVTMARTGSPEAAHPERAPDATPAAAPSRARPPRGPSGEAEVVARVEEADVRDQARRGPARSSGRRPRRTSSPRRLHSRRRK